MYEKLIAELREYWNDGTEDLRNQAADAIEELQASVRGYEMNTDMAFVKEDGRTVIRFIPKVQCPHYIRNVHDRGDDSLCEKYRCEVKALPRWIPVTERLPEKLGKYLVCGQWRGKPAETWVCELIAFGNIKGWVNEARNPAVTHWMPLPEPPKGEAE